MSGGVRGVCPELGPGCCGAPRVAWDIQGSVGGHAWVSERPMGSLLLSFWYRFGSHFGLIFHSFVGIVFFICLEVFFIGFGIHFV